MNLLSQKSNAVKSFRSKIRKELKELDTNSSLLRCSELIYNPPSELMRMKIGKLLVATRGIGQNTSDKILDCYKISPYATLMELDSKEKDYLYNSLMGRKCKSIS